MRSTRLRKFRKKHQWLIISIKTVLILYIIIYSASYLTSDTVAYFDGKNVSNILITAGTWENDEDEEKEEIEDGEKDSVRDEGEEDMSALAFVIESETTQANCMIEIQVKNTGEGPMLSEGFYEVYYSEKIDPKIEGESVEFNEGEGIIPILNKEEKISITFEPNKNGTYRFVLYGSNDIPVEDWLWSDVIEIDCLEEDEETNGEEKIKEPTNEAEKLKDSQEDKGEVEEHGKEAITEENKDIPPIEDEEDVGEDEQEENNEVDE